MTKSDDERATQWTYKSTWWYFWVSVAIVIISWLILAFFVKVEVRTAYRKWKKFRKAKFIPKLIWFLSAATMVAWELSATSWVLTRIQPPNRKKNWVHVCRLGTSMVGFWYTTAKSLMYTVLILRLHTAFAASNWAYSRRTIGIFLVYVGIVTIGNWIHTLIFPWAVTNWVDGLWVCSGGFSNLGLAWTALNDTILCISTMYLFLRPLRLVLKEANRISSEEDVDKSATGSAGKRRSKKQSKKKSKASSNFVYLSSKYAVLGTIGAGSSFIALLILAFTAFSPLGVIDAVVSGVSMAMMAKQYDDLYQSICCCFIRKEHRRKNTGDAPSLKRVSTATHLSSGAPSALSSSGGGSDLIRSSDKRSSHHGSTKLQLVRALSHSSDDAHAAGSPQMPTSDLLSPASPNEAVEIDVSDAEASADERGGHQGVSPRQRDLDDHVQAGGAGVSPQFKFNEK